MMKQRRPEVYSWWKHGVIYHIYPRSFMDSNGDGVGDIRGIISKLDYLSDLGIDAIWLSPIFLSPMIDFGYDVSDYRSIDPVFGTMDDFRILLDEAHRRNIRVVCDMILNHTSDEHPWFRESRSSKFNPKRQWYIWKDGFRGGPPNNWKSAVGGSAWTLDEHTGQYYLHSFFGEQPDLNWRNPEVIEALLDEMKYWLDMGVDGFRLDVINLIAKDKKFRDNPYLFGITFFQKHRFTRNRKKSKGIVLDLRKLTEQYEDKLLVGEIYTMPPGDSRTAASYLANGKGIHLAFDFSLIFQSWSAAGYYKCIYNWYSSIPENGWPCNVLSNHDLLRSINRRPWTRFREQKAKVAAAFLLTVLGTPFIYYGEEIGMQNAKISKNDIADPLGKKFWPFFSGRDQARTPMQWNAGENAGFTTGKPWLPVNRDYVIRNTEKQKEEPDSIFNLYRSIIQVRRTDSILQQGRWVAIITGRSGVLVYSRVLGNSRTIVILNFTQLVKKIRLPEHIHGFVMFSTHRKTEEVFYFQDLRVHPFEISIYKTI